jgi:hypothetical protein
MPFGGILERRSTALLRMTRMKTLVRLYALRYGLEDALTEIAEGLADIPREWDSHYR